MRSRYNQSPSIEATASSADEKGPWRLCPERESATALSKEYGSRVISNGIRFSRTACRMKILMAVVMFIPKSAKSASACFFSSLSVLILMFVSICLPLCKRVIRCAHIGNILSLFLLKFPFIRTPSSPIHYYYRRHAKIEKS